MPTVTEAAIEAMERAKNEILELRAVKADLLECVKHALVDAQTRLYLLPASDDYATSSQREILGTQIGKYSDAIARAEGESK